MNTEANQEKTAAHSTGERLRLAREARGLSQQNVAERLCLKLSTVRDIEEDKTPADLAATFLRGYIRSYARLVHVPESDILPMLSEQAPVRAAKITPMHNISLGGSRRRKKRDGMLMTFTLLVILVVIGLTVAWWWQNHKASQADLNAMTNTSASGNSSEQSIPLNGNSDDASTGGTSVPLDTDNSAPTTTDTPAANTTGAETAPTADSNNSAATATGTGDNQTPAASSAVVSPSQVTTPTATPAAPVATPAPTSTTDTSSPVQPTAAATPASGDALVMNFHGDCWLQVTDASGKKLFSGLQHNGGTLNLTGKTPYRVRIGAPGSVSVQFRGQPVDLSRFVRTNQVARLTIGA